MRAIAPVVSLGLLLGCRSPSPSPDAGASTSPALDPDPACYPRGSLATWPSDPSATVTWRTTYDKAGRSTKLGVTLDAPFAAGDRVDGDDLLDRSLLLAELIRPGTRFSGIRIHAALNTDGTLTRRGDGERPHALVDFDVPVPNPASTSLGPPVGMPGTIDYADRFTFSFRGTASKPLGAAHPLPCCPIRSVVKAIVESGVSEGTSGWLTYGDDVAIAPPAGIAEIWTFAVSGYRGLNRTVDARSCAVIP